MSRRIGRPAGDDRQCLQALPVAHATRTTRLVLLSWAIVTVAGFSTFAVFAERGHAGTALGLLMTAMSLASAVVVNASFDAVGLPALRRRFGAVMAIWLPWFTLCLFGLVFLNSAFAGAPVVLGLVAVLPLVAALTRGQGWRSTAPQHGGDDTEEDRVLAVLGGVEHLDEALAARLLGMRLDTLRAVVRPLEEQQRIRVGAGALRRRRLSAVGPGAGPGDLSRPSSGL